MKNKEVLLFNSNSKMDNRNSKFAFRAIVRYAILIIIAILLTLNLFQIDLKNIDQFKDKKEILISILIKMLVIILIAIIALKLNEYYFNGAIFSFIMVSGIMSYAIFVYSHMSFNLIGDVKQYVDIIYYLLPIIGIAFAWYVGIWFFERKTRPYISLFAIWKMIAISILFLIAMLIFALLKHYSNILDTKTKTFEFYFNMYDDYESALIVFIALLVMALLIVIGIRTYIFRKIKSTKTVRNTSIGMAIMIIAPLLIWYSSMAYQNPSVHNRDLLLFFVELIPVLSVTVFAFLKRVRIASPTVKMLVYSLSILGVWMIKFWFDYYWSKSITREWENVIVLSALLYILVVMFALDVSLQKSFATAIRSISLLIMVYILFYSVGNMYYDDNQTILEYIKSTIEKIREDDWSNKGLPPSIVTPLTELLKWEIPDILNTLVLTSAVWPALVSSLSWYRVQSKINRKLGRQYKFQKKAGKDAKQAR